MLLLSQMLAGFGAAPLFTYGISYMDENVAQKNVALYLGKLYRFLYALFLARKPNKV